MSRSSAAPSFTPSRWRASGVRFAPTSAANFARKRAGAPSRFSRGPSIASRRAKAWVMPASLPVRAEASLYAARRTLWAMRRRRTARTMARARSLLTGRRSGLSCVASKSVGASTVHRASLPKPSSVREPAPSARSAARAAASRLVHGEAFLSSKMEPASSPNCVGRRMFHTPTKFDAEAEAAKMRPREKSSDSALSLSGARNSSSSTSRAFLENAASERSGVARRRRRVLERSD